MNAIRLPCGHLKDSVPCRKIQDLGPTCIRGQALVKKDRAYIGTRHLSGGHEVQLRCDQTTDRTCR